MEEANKEERRTTNECLRNISEQLEDTRQLLLRQLKVTTLSLNSFCYIAI